MSNFYKSNSVEQVLAGDYLFTKIQSHLGVKLESNARVYLNDSHKSYIEPDFYSEEFRIIGEIFAHIGSLKVGQKHKIANDILKMVLLEQATGKRYHKMIVTCDPEIVKYLNGYSYIAESVRQFDIEIISFTLSDDMIASIASAQKRQKMVNA